MITDDQVTAAVDQLVAAIKPDDEAKCREYMKQTIERLRDHPNEQGQHGKVVAKDVRIFITEKGVDATINGRWWRTIA
jgi:hypothetical protein